MRSLISENEMFILIERIHSVKLRLTWNVFIIIYIHTLYTCTINYKS